MFLLEAFPERTGLKEYLSQISSYNLFLKSVLSVCNSEAILIGDCHPIRFPHTYLPSSGLTINKKITVHVFYPQGA